MIYLIYQTDTGEIISYGNNLIVNDNVIECGGTKLTGFKVDKVSLGSCDVWIEDATNISELGVISSIGITDREVDYDTWKSKEKAVFKLLVDEINTLRLAVGLPGRTKAQIVQALKNKLS